MTEAKLFSPWKLITGIMYAVPEYLEKAKAQLIEQYGPVDLESQSIPFDQSPYYADQFERPVKRRLVSFEPLVDPASLSGIKLETNQREKQMKEEAGGGVRVINLDPGILSASSLIMATAKDFAHRIPLQKGIYAHLELMFGKNDIRTLPWTYPDFRDSRYHSFLLEARRIYLARLRSN
jgi:hypothetical protein